MDKKRIIYAVDRVEGDIAVLENTSTKEIINVDKSILPDVIDGDILVYENGTYIKDDNLKNEKLESVRERMNILKRSE